MIDFATTWWIHASLALGIAALVECIPSVPYTLRDAVWRVGVVVPFVTAAMQSLGFEPVVTTAAFVEPLQVIGNSAPQASTSIDLTHLLFAAWATLAFFGLIHL